MVIIDSKTGEGIFICRPTIVAKKVFLVGDFNDWEPEAKRMVRVAKDGSFRARLSLEPGRYEYKFIIDDLWVSDPDAKEQATNPFGTTNSVLVIAPPAACGCDCDSCA